MYIFSIRKTDDKVVDIAVDGKSVGPIAGLLENSKDVVDFKVSDSGRALDQKAFGFGGYIKWTFYNVPEVEEVLNSSLKTCY